MAKDININFSNWQATGTKVQVDQYTANVSLSWVDDQNQPHTWSGNVTFPNDLALVPLAWLKELLVELIIRVARKRLGVDD